MSSLALISGWHYIYTLYCTPNTYGQYMDFRVGLFTVNMNYYTLVYRIVIHQELLIKFSCNLHKTLDP